MHKVAEIGRMSRVILLVENRADVNIKDDKEVHTYVYRSVLYYSIDILT